ncbi:hypothetical protein THIOM_002743 [Candidatus Thiomargarita nelsonii]|uniref:Uncharacterized protein n=1 Tax=Candidatus Thiomargarita nelsonii TaxID=1003181 RepID=A0A0A6NYL6_9GAMM|nr:hypothetical protein THIOM_002743 [Candidatus Thiomargarita nelsonii]
MERSGFPETLSYEPDYLAIMETLEQTKLQYLSLDGLKIKLPEGFSLSPQHLKRFRTNLQNFLQNAVDQNSSLLTDEQEESYAEIARQFASVMTEDVSK